MTDREWGSGSKQYCYKAKSLLETDLLSPGAIPIGYSTMNAVYLVKSRSIFLFKNFSFCLYSVSVYITS
jgi:hypothetical protein